MVELVNRAWTVALLNAACSGSRRRFDVMATTRRADRMVPTADSFDGLLDTPLLLPSEKPQLYQALSEAQAEAQVAVAAWGGVGVSANGEDDSDSFRGPESGGLVEEDETKVCASEIYGLEHLVRMLIALPGMMGPVSE